jgi:cytochrome P450
MKYAKDFFSEGPRICLGWRYATTLLKILLVRLLTHFEFDANLKFEELEFKMIVSMNVCQGYQVKIKERNW